MAELEGRGLGPDRGRGFVSSCACSIFQPVLGCVLYMHGGKHGMRSLLRLG
jgi:hypothetical protein